MTRKALLILNPQSNMGDAEHKIAEIEALTASHNDRITLVRTTHPKHAAQLARDAAGKYDLVIAMGGDGTVHEVANGLLDTPEDQRPALAIIPNGSGNDFAFGIRAPGDFAKAIDLAMSGDVTRVDAVRMTDQDGRREYFDNTAGIGFDAVVTIRSHKLPLLRGFVMYLVAVIQTIILNHDHHKMQIETDGEKWERANIMVTLCNGPREGGGFVIAPNAKIDDSMLDYCMVEECSRLKMFRLIPEFMKGTHTTFNEIKMGQCKTMKLTSNLPLYIHLDGEVYSTFGTNLKSVMFEILPGALKVIRER
jgi:YegS/Rv2252/BmrU family lipid kinase